MGGWMTEARRDTEYAKGVITRMDQEPPPAERSPAKRPSGHSTDIPLTWLYLLEDLPMHPERNPHPCKHSTRCGVCGVV